MLAEHYETIEAIGLNLFFLVIFLLIGLAIQDVLKKGNVPKYGRYIVWLVLFLGCAGFISKEVIRLIWENSGIG
ncbi:DUF2788 domain-containing protein [Gallaecimonas kandeliae]|uniref:DUF2788 domain-containing protein n=1 Tax=Gallaecimonas kandeliae TaxID=3029055 RepID=UPI002648D799|nr:DUF2788 domain-containing protein [Gallaecimonas kandeliae]WKE67194.1 DUF2788 domain-containing protein [Gallaecimonas kandeliae]